MISKECFSAQWLQEVSEARKFNDKGLIEKVVRAMSLLEALVEAAAAAELRLQKTIPLQLARLRAANPEAFWYWAKISEMLAL